MLPHMQSKNGEKLKVSVIICTLDKNRILPETIPSIKRSSIVNELIIIERLRPIGYSRDVGWRKAQNEIMCFIDNDEIVPDGWIERLANEFKDPKIGAVWSTVKPINKTKINTLECILQNHTLKRFSENARFVRKKALEDIGGYEHTIGEETVYVARKMMQHGWKIKIVDYPLLHKMFENANEWVLCLYRTGKGCAPQLLKHKELLPCFKQALGSVLREFQLSILYKEPLLFVFYPLRCWLHFCGVLRGSLRIRNQRASTVKNR